jgi:hypothetical protein
LRMLSAGNEGGARDQSRVARRRACLAKICVCVRRAVHAHARVRERTHVCMRARSFHARRPGNVADVSYGSSSVPGRIWQGCTQFRCRSCDGCLFRRARR